LRELHWTGTFFADYGLHSDIVGLQNTRVGPHDVRILVLLLCKVIILFFCVGDKCELQLWDSLLGSITASHKIKEKELKLIVLQRPQIEKRRVVKKLPQPQFVKVQGYLNLFPFILTILTPDAPELVIS